MMVFDTTKSKTKQKDIEIYWKYNLLKVEGLKDKCNMDRCLFRIEQREMCEQVET